MEIWKKIEGYDKYQVSDLGRVKSLKRNRVTFLKQFKNGRGYLSVPLYNNGKCNTKRVHVLVAESFLNHKTDGTTKISIDHINDNPLDNRLLNLQLISHRENIEKSVTNKNGLTGVKSYGDKFCSYITVNNKYKHLGVFETKEEAHNEYKRQVLILNK